MDTSPHLISTIAFLAFVAVTVGLVWYNLRDMIAHHRRMKKIDELRKGNLNHLDELRKLSESDWKY